MVLLRGGSHTASSMRQAPVADFSLPPAQAKLLPARLGDIADGEQQKQAGSARGSGGFAVRCHKAGEAAIDYHAGESVGPYP